MLYSARNKDEGVPVDVSNEPLPYKSGKSPDEFWRYAGNPTNPRLREQRFWPKAQVETVAKEFPKEALIDWDDDEVFRVFVGQQEKAAQIDYDEERYIATPPCMVRRRDVKHAPAATPTPHPPGVAVARVVRAQSSRGRVHVAVGLCRARARASAPRK